MVRGKYEKLLEQQSKWQGFIYEAERTQKKTLENMIELREELRSLARLKVKYPESHKVIERMNTCDKLLKQYVETLNVMKEKLAEFKKQKDDLERFITQYNESTISESTRLKL
ncbi:MAG: hypothetical protein JJT82_08510 [Legionellaceae bacterium]|nr:hypothetical protein [Legionellaceae bacterium]